MLKSYYESIISPKSTMVYRFCPGDNLQNRVYSTMNIGVRISLFWKYAKSHENRFMH